MNLLLVEDSKPEALYLTERLTECADCEVENVKTLSAAKQRYQSADVLLCDLALPDSEPDDTVRWLKRVRHEKPCVVVSGLEDPGTVRRLGQMGILFLPKDYLTESKGRLMLQLFIGLAEKMSRLARATRKVLNSKLFSTV